MRRLKSKWWLGLLLGVLFFAPRVSLFLYYRETIFADVASLRPHEYGVLFGAYVLADGTLTDVTKERAAAAALLYHQGKIRRIFVSATERDNYQATAIATYLIEQGVPAAALTIDELGIDSGDTCRHFATLADQGILITQGYHLPRVMWLCQREGVKAVGIAVNRLGLLDVRGRDPFAIFFTRTGRFIREAALTWAIVLGLDGKFSQEAEEAE